MCLPTNGNTATRRPLTIVATTPNKSLLSSKRKAVTVLQNSLSRAAFQETETIACHTPAHKESELLLSPPPPPMKRRRLACGLDSIPFVTPADGEECEQPSVTLRFPPTPQHLLLPSLLDLPEKVAGDFPKLTLKPRLSPKLVF